MEGADPQHGEAGQEEEKKTVWFLWKIPKSTRHKQARRERNRPADVKLERELRAMRLHDRDAGKKKDVDYLVKKKPSAATAEEKTKIKVAMSQPGSQNWNNARIVVS